MSREYMVQLPPWLHWGIYVFALLPTVLVFGWLMTRRVQRSGTTWGELGRGLTEAFQRNPKTVTRRVVGDVFGQVTVRRDRLGALLHLLIFGSFGLLVVGTALVAVEQDFTRLVFGWRFLTGGLYAVFEAVLDTATLTLIAGVLVGMWRRYRLRPAHLGGRTSVHVVYGALGWLALSGLLLEAGRLLAVPVEHGGWSYAGNGLAALLDPVVGDHAVGFYQVFWAAHAISAFVFLALIPLLMLDHIVVLPLTLAIQADREPGRLTTPFDLPAIVEAEGDLEGISAGVANPVDHPWQRRFMLDACIDCGRCEAVCPAHAAGRPLSPRQVVQALGADLRTSIAAGAPPEADVFARGVVTEDIAWSCLTCGACARECPALVDQPGSLVELRRHLVEGGQVPERQAGVLEAVERNQNPLGLPSYQRTDWMTGLDVPTLAENPQPEYLYWIGCMAAYDQRARSVAQAMVKILKHAGVSFAVLGEEEVCCGEAQRKLGDEAGFQMRAMENIALFAGYEIVKVLTHCPHCLATLTKDYPEFGAKIEVVHHSVLLAELLASGKVPAVGGAGSAAEVGTLTFHDPCNLGRLGGVLDPPRAVCQAAAGPRFVEIGQSKDTSFCCGAGGGNYFYKVPEERSVSSLRLAQASATGADTVAVACPFCLGMLEDAARSASDSPLRIADLAELVASGLPEEKPPEEE
ncbi:MAG: heterodisulfide reductase-related iron-sulfur binding cluster [Micrococcales bacterium]|nr:heterodisulfide reductase-related iron-sulfur binding cluster [Micrococcales bacterium]